MTTILTSLFYLWLVTSILLVTLWFLRRQDQARADEPDPDTMLPGFDGPALQITPARIEEKTASVDRSAELGSDADSVDGAAAEPDGPASDTTSKKQDGNSGSDPKSRADSGSKSGSDSGSKAEPQPDSECKSVESISGNATDVEADPASDSEPIAPIDLPVRAHRPPSLVDLLEGISLPFDLIPLTASLEDPDRHAVFLSSHDDAGEVGTAFADQLAGIGFAIEPEGFDQAVAKRNGDVLSMRISANAGATKNGDTARFPTAGESDVAIEVWTGTGPPPPLSN